MAVYGPAVAGRGGLLYSFGGRATGSVITAASYSYNPATDTWSPIASLPSARYLAAAVTDGTYIYILNGSYSANSVTNTLWRYDPSTNSYTTLASPTAASRASGAAYLNGKIYRIAGEIDPANGAGTRTVEVYDIATNSWSAVANYPLTILGLTALPLNGYIYTAGGMNYSDRFAKAYRYDPGTNTWDDGPIADLPEGEASMASGFYNNRWIVAPAAGYVSTNAIAWDPATNNWTSLDQMSNATWQAGGAVVAGAFYVVDGYNSGATPINTVQKYVETICTSPSPTPPAGATPTSCPIQFSDVAQGSTFYTYVRCLACRGIINGYSDNTFRPNNNVTRGQLAKIVTNAAGFTDPQTTQLFEDVPPGSTFYDFAGRLASRGIIGGYQCSGASEPCVPPGNLPYFRPGSNATRGQTAKIVANTFLPGCATP